MTEIRVTIGEGGERTLPPFSAFKALYAMELIGTAEAVVRQLVHEAGDFRAEYASRHTLRMSRAEARRQFGPVPLMRPVATDQGIAYEPLRDEAGGAVMGPDPLAHLTEADWQASGHELVVPEQPDDDLVMAALVPKAFKLARADVLRLLALVLATNRDLEDWDEAGTVDSELDAAGKRLVHEATAEQLVQLAVAALELGKDQLAGPVGKARAQMQELWTQATQPTPSPEGDELPAPPQEPMRVETSSSQESSTPSPADTAGTPEPSLTAPAGASS